MYFIKYLSKLKVLETKEPHILNKRTNTQVFTYTRTTSLEFVQ